VGPPTLGASSISLSQNNGNSRVDWQLSLGAASNSANLFMPLQSYGGSYDSDWTAELDVENWFAPQAGQSTQIGILAFNTNGMSVGPTADYVKLVKVQADASYGGLAQGNVIHYGSHTNGTPAAFSTTPTGVYGWLRLEYSASAHTIAVYNGATLLRTFGIAGSGGDTTQDWGMTSGDTFTLGVYAQSSTNESGTGFTLSEGMVYATSFTGTGLVAAIPEPSTYVALFGLAALGFAAYRKRHRKTA
jgi:hypothetical protein